MTLRGDLFSCSFLCLLDLYGCYVCYVTICEIAIEKPDPAITLDILFFARELTGNGVLRSEQSPRPSSPLVLAPQTHTVPD